ncbi:MAG: zf-HC2 domain-containing protein [Rhodoferax sp.]
MKWLKRSCKQVTALLVAQEDRALPWLERLALRLHLSVCKACPRFQRQMLTMRHAMGQWRHYSESDTSLPPGQNP